MRRGPVRKTRRGIFQPRFIIPIIFLLVGVFVAYGLLRERTPPPPPDPVIIWPDDYDAPPIPDLDEPVTQREGEISAEPFPAVVPLPVPIEPVVRDDPFANPRERVGAFRVNSTPLKRTVDQYAGTRANQCSGEIIVRTEDTPLNVRSAPSTSGAVLSKAAKDSRQSVLMWAPDARTNSGRWFLLVDSNSKTVKGWVSGEYCDTANVVFAN
jgi:hypothetical protein